MRSEIWIGDLVRALTVVPAGGRAADTAVARMLGFAVRPVEPRRPAAGHGQARADAPDVAVADPGRDADDGQPARFVARAVDRPTPIVTPLPQPSADAPAPPDPPAPVDPPLGGPAGPVPDRPPPAWPPPGTPPGPPSAGPPSAGVAQGDTVRPTGAEPPAWPPYAEAAQPTTTATGPATGPARGPAATDADRPVSWVPALTPASFGAVPSAGWRAAVLPRVRRTRRALDPRHQLFAPRSSSAILHLALAQPAPDGPVNLPALIDSLARCRPVDTLPRLPVPTLRFGVDMLIDTGTGMELFDRDVRDLLQQVRRVAGPGQVTVTRFAHAPLRGAGGGPRAGWRSYEPPHPRVRVMVVSDFGMGGPGIDHRRASVEEWVEFAHRIRRHGCDAVALTPYPRRRWPEWLPALFPVVPWDRNVTVGQVAARMGGR
jgi:hypothetical protein